MCNSFMNPRRAARFASPYVDLGFDVLAISHAVKCDWCILVDSQETGSDKGTVSVSRRLQCILSCAFDWKEVRAPRCQARV